MQSRSQQTLTIEAMLKEGHTASAIAREVGVSRPRVQQIKRRLKEDHESVTAPAEPASTMKALTIHFTPAVHDALAEACAIANRQSPEEPITITEYIEELVINRVVELGLLRKNKRS